MKTYTFAVRCIKEILRDPLNILFGVGFPTVILIILSIIQSNVPVDLFEIGNLAPGVCIFGLSFITLFTATLIAKDRETSYLQRLYTTPLKPHNYLLGYTLSVLPISLAQSTICYLVAIMLGLKVTLNIVVSIALILPISLFYISMGLLFGVLLNVKQVGGVCGALLTNLSAWLSGIWFDIDMIGGIFAKISYCLPFIYAVELQRSIIAGSYKNVLLYLAVIFAYTVAIAISASYVFIRKMRE